MSSADRLQRARAHLAAGNVVAAHADAEASLRSARTDRDRSQARLVLAACAQKAGNIASGVDHARAAIAADAANALAHYVLAQLLEAQKDLAGALASVQRAVDLDPASTAAWFYRGILAGEAGDVAGAIAAFERTVELDPRHARAWNNLGNALRMQGRAADAQRAFERAVALKPDYWLAVANLARSLRDVGEVESAESLLRSALANAGETPFRPLLVLLAGLTRERGLLDESAQLYWRAIQAAPKDSAPEWFHLGWVLGERNELAKAREAYGRAYALDRAELRALLGAHLALPVVYADADALQRARAAFSEGLDALERDIAGAVAGLEPAAVVDGLRWGNFFLAYQGRNDRDLQARYAAMVARAVEAGAPQWREPLPAHPVTGRRIRVGFASAFLHVGTVGRYFSSWITELPRDRFEVFVYHLWPGMDDVANAVHARADVFRTFGGSEARPSSVAPAIRADALDLLIYPELGMDVTSFALAALRLAPRQWSAWGHPVTTGHATIDAFLTCETMEPADAREHYTERLLLLPGIGTRYGHPSIPTDATRARFGLPEDRVLLLCPQSLFKIHPDNDELLAEVLLANPDALLLLFSARHPAVTDHFMRRVERRFAQRGIAVRERVMVLPQLPHDDYLRINCVADAMLDTLHWSGGNTSLDALGCGLPVVTLPGAYMRGRQSAAMLRLLGVEELVARDRADYVAIASRLVRDTAWRASLAQRIRDHHPRLFGRGDALARLVQLIESEVALNRGPD